MSLFFKTHLRKQALFTVEDWLKQISSLFIYVLICEWARARVHKLNFITSSNGNMINKKGHRV